MANIKGKQLTDSLSVTNVTGSNISASGLITGDSGSLGRLDVSDEINVAQHIRHLDDANTFINFTDDTRNVSNYCKIHFDNFIN